VARAAVLGRLTPRLEWLEAGVAAARHETPRVRTLVLDVPGWPGHVPGQRVDVRLTADDGYQARRSYSVASAPEPERLELTVERIADGEVSPYLVNGVEPGDRLELRGPIGGWFAWEPGGGGPLLLVAGGSGIVPLMSMLRAHAAGGSDVPVRLLYSSRSLEDVIYRDELERLAARPSIEVAHTLTRSAPPGWTGHRHRLGPELLEAFAWPADARPLAYVCGPGGLVEKAATALVELGYEPQRVRTERFGPSGS
jgi:ferredoxin-NADP reductase